MLLRREFLSSSLRESICVGLPSPQECTSGKRDSCPSPFLKWFASFLSRIPYENKEVTFPMTRIEPCAVVRRFLVIVDKPLVLLTVGRLYDPKRLFDPPCRVGSGSTRPPCLSFQLLSSSGHSRVVLHQGIGQCCPRFESFLLQ